MVTLFYTINLFASTSRHFKHYHYDNQNKGKTALILGGTSGIGEATAELLLQCGANVHVVGKSEHSLGSALQVLRGLGTVTGHQVDLTNQPDVISFIEKFSKKVDPIHYLVNASGIFVPKPFLDYKPEEYDAYLDLNQDFFFTK